PWIFFLHGNASTIASRMNVLHYEGLRGLGVNVIAPEYRGYGGLDGVPTEAGIENDARSAYDTICERLHIDPKRIVVYGWSLGSAVTVDLASQVQPAAVILEGAPASIVAIAEQRYPLFPIRLLIRNPFESIRKIDGVKSPKLFLHSAGDEIVPIEEGRRLFDAAPQPKQWIQVRGGHVYAAERDPAFFGYVRTFLSEQRLLNRQ
ncbi:MAG TPA: alpha/beta hydrolase, partial [Vicinamibacterales bacterium]|nr:alpha/beta hydrolase [Vicinamibacterales bacterium]